MWACGNDKVSNKIYKNILLESNPQKMSTNEVIHSADAGGLKENATRYVQMSLY